MPEDELLQRLRRFHDDAFPLHAERFRALVEDGQHPATLFIGCSDSRPVPYMRRPANSRCTAGTT